MSGSGPIEFMVYGTPAPKGSSRAMPKKSGGAILVPSGSKPNQERLKDWKSAVMREASIAVGRVEHPPFVQVPIKVSMAFRIRRPKNHFGKKGLLPSAPKYPIGKPDEDKLVRATRDALNMIVYDDDSRIVESRTRKRWALPGEEGVWIRVEEVKEKANGQVEG